MRVSKNEIQLNKEKVETLNPKKNEQHDCHIKIRCVNCGKICAEVDEIVMGKVVVKCDHCGMKNRIDQQSAVSGRGQYI